MTQITPGGYQVRVNYGNAVSPSPPEPPKQTPQQLQARTLAVARALEPKQAVGFRKVRLGRDFDGGYILLDDFVDIGAALSFGVSDDVSWDLDIAARNILVHQFDHTVERSPVDNPLFRFYRQRVSGTVVPGAVSLDSIVERCLAGCERAILKIDIEGDEWEVFKSASPASLERFSQIVCEFHALKHAGDVGWSEYFQDTLTKLRAVFEVVHVHGNNAGPFVNIANVVLPDLLEVTFANRRYYEFAETNEIFPTALDQPNLPAGPDMRLGCFKF
jgi:hypothetical protein